MHLLQCMSLLLALSSSKLLRPHVRSRWKLT
jgi:hypothetical protein